MPLTGNKRRRVAKSSRSIHSVIHKRFAGSTDQGQSTPLSGTAKTLQLIKEGDEKIALNDEYKSAIIVLGDSEAEKSTFVQWAAEKDDQLISKEKADNTGEYFIQAASKISDNGAQSMAIFPQLVVDTKNNTAYYDCPDITTRSAANDIAQTYFMKRLSGHLTEMKLVFVVSHSAINKTESDPHSLPSMLAHASAFINDIDKLEKSISLVVSKVVPPYNPQRREVDSDEKVMASIADSLRQTKNSFAEKLTDPRLSDKKKASAARVIKFIDIFLIKDGGDYGRISLFKQPNDDGRLDQIESMVEGKKSVQKVLYGTLQYTEMKENDFAFTVSDESKNEISALTAEIDSNVWSTLKSMVEKIEIHYLDSVETTRDHLRYLTSGSYSLPPVESRAGALLPNLTAAAEVATSLMTSVKDASIDKLAKEIKQGITRLDITALDDDLASISSQGKFYEFLQAVNQVKSTARPWEDLLKSLPTHLTDLHQEIHAEIQQTANNVRSEIEASLADLKKEIKILYDDKIKMISLKELSSQYQDASNIIHEMDVRFIKLPATGQTLLEKVNYITSKLAVDNDVAQSVSLNISKLVKTLTYLDAISGSNKFNEAEEWLFPFKHLKGHFEDLLQWYSFLGELSKKLSAYDQQSKKSFYSGDTITKDNFKDFMHKIAPLGFRGLTTVIHSGSTNDERIQEINELLDITVKTDVRVHCQSDTLFVEGDIVKFSDFIDDKGAIKACDGGKAPKQLNIFALSKLFIDRDLQAIDSKLLVAAIAPKWEVVGSRKIDLSGSDGPNPYKESAKKGRENEKGENGARGEPGGSAGSFFGIAGKVSKNSWGKLSVKTSGGAGGNGQKGGEGGPGSNGTSPPDKPDGYPPEKYGRCTGRETTHHWGGFATEFKCKSSAWEKQCSVTLYGLLGLKGGRGGSGGAGGNGGRAGNVDLFFFDGEPQVEIANNSGVAGRPGEGGSGGKGGNQGNTVKLECEELAKGQTDRIKIKEVLGAGPAATGEAGPSGADLSNDKNPEAAATIARRADIINVYKRYLTKNLKHRLKNYTLTRFLNNLDSNDSVLKIHRTLDFIEDMLRLEEQSKELNLSAEFVTLQYKSLMDRIVRYADQPPADEASSEYKSALNYLYTTILSKLHHMKADTEYTLVIDVEEYLKLVDVNIKTLSDIKERRNKFEVIDKYKAQYKAGIDKKITEADGFVQDQLKPEIKKLESKMNSEMDSLVAEIKELIKSANENKEEIIKQKKKMQQQLIAKTIFNVIDGATTVVSCLGPHGAVAGAAIGGTSAIAKALVLEDIKPVKVAIKATVTGLQKLGEAVYARQEQKIAKLKKRLERISKELEPHPELDEVAERVKRLQENSENLVDKKGKMKDFDKSVESLKKQAKDEISVMEKKLKEQKETTEAKKKKLTSVLTKCSKIVGLAEAGFDVYEKYLKDAKEVKEVSDSLDEVNENIRELEQYENRVYSSIAPSLERVAKDIDGVVAGVTESSQVALDVTKWEVQTSLRDMKLAMRDATKGMKVQDGLVRCIEKLSEVMTTLINIYDRIQGFQDQQKLADYLAQITSVTAGKIGFPDKAIDKAVSDLEILIRSNLMLEQYQTAISSVKQWVFPFAQKYFEYSNAMLPSQIQIKSHNIDELANEAAKQVSLIRQKVREYKVSIKSTDKNIHNADFDGDDPATSPFYVWKNGEHKDIISRLLAGEAISVSADVTHSAPNKDAIKFNLIELTFRSANKNVQLELNEKLRHFEVNATHMGNSYYRYKNKFYVMWSSAQEITFSFSKNSDTHYPKDYNIVYDKISKGDIMLSPFAMWKIQLNKLGGSVTYRDLKAYSDEVDLELAGKGSYVSGSADIPNFNEGDYYELSDNVYLQSGTISSEVTEKSRLRRAVRPPVASSATKPSSLLNTFVSLSKKLIGLLGNNQVYHVPPPVDDWHESIDLETFEASAPLGIGRTVTEDGDVFFNNTDVNGLLTWGTLFARKWSGFRPRATRTASHDASTGIELAIRSHELVDAFIRKLEQLARSRGVQSSDTISDHKFYSDCVSVVRGKLARGEDCTVAASLVELVSKAMWQLKQADLDCLLSEVTEDLDDLNGQLSQKQVSHSMQCNREQCVYITSTEERTSLRQHMSDFNSLDATFDLPQLSHNVLGDRLIE